MISRNDKRPESRAFKKSAEIGHGSFAPLWLHRSTAKQVFWELLYPWRKELQNSDNFLNPRLLDLLSFPEKSPANGTARFEPILEVRNGKALIAIRTVFWPCDSNRAICFSLRTGGDSNRCKTTDQFKFFGIYVFRMLVACMTGSVGATQEQYRCIGSSCPPWIESENSPGQGGGPNSDQSHFACHHRTKNTANKWPSDITWLLMKKIPNRFCNICECLDNFLEKGRSMLEVKRAQTFRQGKGTWTFNT